MKKLFALASIASLMFSCSENIEETPFEEKLPISISVDMQTRANDTTFESGDAVGIYVVNYDGTTAGTLKAEGNQADNAEFTYNGGGWNSDEPIYWKDKNTSADFYAYYPYSASVNIAAQPFVVQADQSNEDNFLASDFLWGKSTKVAPTSNAVNIQTNHVLSRIIVEIKPGSGFTSASWAAANKSVKICDIKTNATINLATGVATATGNNGEIVPLATSSNYKAMVVPQTVADGSKLIVVTVDGTEYVYRTGCTFKANTQHNFSIVVNNNESSVNVAIGEWDIDGTVNNGTAVEEDNTNNQITYCCEKKFDYNWTFESFGANIISHEYTIVDGEKWVVNNIGVITFDNDVTFIGEGAFAEEMWSDNGYTITLPESVTTIGNGAFAGSHLAFINMGNNIRSIGDFAFVNTYLVEINLPNSLKTIGKGAFQNCLELQEITLPESITSIGEAAFRSTSITTIYCKATTPPSIGSDVFLENELTIKVPTTSVNAYKLAENWSNYSDYIVGYDF